MPDQTYPHQFPDVAALFADADIIDHKTIDGDPNLRAFVAGFLSYQPSWVTMLYRIRARFVRLLGMRQDDMPFQQDYDPAAIPFTPGERMYIFQVKVAQEDAYWFAEADEPHLRAALGIVREPLADGHNRYHVITLVYDHNWRGPVYFNVIRPFHHLVVRQMMHYALRPSHIQSATLATENQ